MACVKVSARWYASAQMAASKLDMQTEEQMAKKLIVD